jgi:glycine/D-amino acid oxidase-like deaminating enzyme/nitrite reductase/ring-hydroxylating ferredoxin subunit
MRRRRPSFGGAELADDTVVDVCVVGAGIAGLSVAYELTRQGAEVVVLDHGDVGGGETGRTSAHLSNALDDRFYRLARIHGAEAARLAASSHATAIDLIENNARMLGIDCDFQRVDGYLFASPGRPGNELDRELAAARAAGVDVEKVASPPMPFATGPALRFARQARFHPLAYLDGLAATITELGNPIHTGVHVAGIETGKNTPLVVKLEGGGQLGAGAVVDATNASITSMRKLPLRQAAYRTYVISIDVPRDAFGDALFWDTGDPYHYLRLWRDGDRELLLVGGEDHRTGQEHNPEARWNALERWIRTRVPAAGEVVDRWSGQVMEPADGLAFVGKSPDLDNVYVVSGDSGNGLTHAVIASVIIPELLAGHQHPWATLYEPQRSALRGVGTMLREIVSSSMPYTDWLGSGDVDDTAKIPPGDGAVVRRGRHLIAAFRDEQGELHECSARCSHLSAVVQWNAAEKTWDCPAHGSRFDPYGRCIMPPAIGDLGEAPAQRGERRDDETGADELDDRRDISHPDTPVETPAARPRLRPVP